MPAAHARLGPSAAHRWLRCPGSVKLSDGLPDETSEVAAEGTVAHHVREMCLMFGYEPEEFIGDVISSDGFSFVVDEDMVEHLRPSIEWVRERPGKPVNEHRVKLDRWLPDSFGTLDVGVISDKLIIIDDLKFGQGIAVSPVRNEQLMTYALGFWDNVARHETDATDFLIVIDQPRIIGGGGEWRTTLEELLEFGERLKRGYEEVHAENPYLQAGEKQCQFCPLKGTCPELARWSMNQMDMVLDDLDGEELTTADIEQFDANRRAMVADSADLIKKWVKEVEAKVLADAIAGRPTPGLKAVNGKRGNKEWIDTEAAEKFLTERIRKTEAFAAPKLITPTQAEKLIPKSDLDEMTDLWSQAKGKPVLVKQDDKKPALATHDDLLDDLDD